METSAKGRAMVAVLCVGLGGFIGSVGRYLLGLVPVEGDFPLMTFAVNFAGAVLIGAVFEAATEGSGLPDNAVLFLKTGVCGGFTTFSAFSLETLALLERGKYATGALYACGSVLACLAGVVIGRLAVRGEGRYLLYGMDVGALSDNRLASIRNEKIGFVFQSFNLLGKLTALENVKLPLSYAGVRLKEADARARKQLALVGLEGREHHLPNQLSGGQQQRVAIARALVCEPEIILADEPTGALDSRTGVEIMELFKSLHAEGQTVILITHNQELADEAQRVVRIADGLIQEMERGSHAV